MENFENSMRLASPFIKGGELAGGLRGIKRIKNLNIE
jgi:hypothetical protein